MSSTAVLAQPPKPTFLDSLRRFFRGVGAFFASPEGKVVATTVLLTAAATAAGAAIDGRRKPVPRSTRPRLPAHEPPQRSALPPHERVVINRENGTDFEGRAARKLRREFPDAEILAQVTVTTRNGRRRRLDNALAHDAGSRT